MYADLKHANLLLVTTISQKVKINKMGLSQVFGFKMVIWFLPFSGE
jgi:hypothetical protein